MATAKPTLQGDGTLGREETARRSLVVVDAHAATEAGEVLENDVLAFLRLALDWGGDAVCGCEKEGVKRSLLLLFLFSRFGIMVIPKRRKKR